MKALWAWFLDVLLGPACKMPDCNYRARGRDASAYIWHLWDHAGEVR